MKIRLCDLETTDDERAKVAGKPVGICEIGWTDLFEDGRILRPQSHLVDPGLPISTVARGVHHISDAMLQGAMRPDAATQLLMDGMEPGDLFGAHNAAFERLFFGGGPYPWICTMVCAKHLFPDAPSFKNQSLRYYLDLEDELEWPELAMPPHRAGPDSYVTAHIARRLMRERHPTQLIDLTLTPVLQKTCMIGKHRGTLWSDLDPGFLQWVLDKDFDAETKATARHWLSQSRSSSSPFGV